MRRKSWGENASHSFINGRMYLANAALMVLVSMCGSMRVSIFRAGSSHALAPASRTNSRKTASACTGSGISMAALDFVRSAGRCHTAVFMTDSNCASSARVSQRVRDSFLPPASERSKADAGLKGTISRLTALSNIRLVQRMTSVAMVGAPRATMDFNIVSMCFGLTFHSIRLRTMFGCFQRPRMRAAKYSSANVVTVTTALAASIFARASALRCFFSSCTSWPSVTCAHFLDRPSDIRQRQIPVAA